jgi:hypothetical protein
MRPYSDYAFTALGPRNYRAEPEGKGKQVMSHGHDRVNAGGRKH